MTNGPQPGLLDRHGAALLHLAAESIRHGLRHGAPLSPALDSWPEEVRTPGASFVTLKGAQDGRLRGCIGTVEAHRPLVVDVAVNGFNAAFRDPRFPPVREAELTGLDLSLSVLTAPEPFPVADEADLLARLTPGEDGLVLEDQGRRGLFLPMVWEQLPEPAVFVRHLKGKAGLPPDHWSPTVRFRRFHTLGLGNRDLPDPPSVWRPAE